MNRAAHVQLHRFRSSERELVDARNDADGVIGRNDFFGQFSRCLFKTEWPFRIHVDRKDNEQHSRE